MDLREMYQGKLISASAAGLVKSGDWIEGMSAWQRAEALIAMAHPDYQDDLIKDAPRMGIWRRSNK